MRGFATKAAIGVVAIGSFSAAAYAATQARPEAAASRKPSPGAPPTPRITEHPARRALSTSARFSFVGRVPGGRFECRLDRARWRTCKSPTLVTGAVDRHVFSVRSVDRQARRSVPARYRWTVLEAKELTIVPDLSSLGALFPGAPALAIPVTVGNPNPAPIFVTSLKVSVGAEPAGCASADNLALTASNASSSKPLEVPPRGSVRLPARGVRPPTIQLRDLPVNQDACQNARFPLRFSGGARG